MSDPHLLADKIYDALRGQSRAAQESELRFTNFAQKVTSVFLHTAHVAAKTIFRPSLRTGILAKNLILHHARGADAYNAFCAYLAESYPIAASDPKSTTELYALTDGVMSFYEARYMNEGAAYHRDRFADHLTTHMIRQLDNTHTSVTYHHEPDFGDTPLHDMLRQQPFAQNYLYAHDIACSVFEQFKEGRRPRLGDNPQTVLRSGLLLQRAYHQAKDCTFKLHMDTTNAAITASGPLFDRHHAYFAQNGFTVQQHTIPDVSPSAHVYVDTVWKAKPDESYYLIS